MIAICEVCNKKIIIKLREKLPRNWELVINGNNSYLVCSDICKSKALNNIGKHSKINS